PPGGQRDLDVGTGASQFDDAFSMGDFDRDGLPDLALVANARVNLYLGDGAAPAQTPLFVARMGLSTVTVADRDGDGHPDLEIDGTSDIYWYTWSPSPLGEPPSKLPHTRLVGSVPSPATLSS